MADQRVYARTFSQTLTLVAGLFCLEKRVSYRRLRMEFDLDDEILRHAHVVEGLVQGVDIALGLALLLLMAFFRM